MVTHIVEAVTSAFTGLLTGLGSGIVQFFDDVIVVTNGEGEVTGLTNFATWALVFLGVSLALFIVRKITAKVS